MERGLESPTTLKGDDLPSRGGNSKCGSTEVCQLDQLAAGDVATNRNAAAAELLKHCEEDNKKTAESNIQSKRKRNSHSRRLNLPTERLDGTHSKGEDSEERASARRRGLVAHGATVSGPEEKVDPCLLDSGLMSMEKALECTVRDTARVGSGVAILANRNRLSTFRALVAGQFGIPDSWSGEKSLRDWVDWTPVDLALQPAGLMFARAALMNEKRAAAAGPQFQN